MRLERTPVSNARHPPGRAVIEQGTGGPVDAELIAAALDRPVYPFLLAALLVRHNRSLRVAYLMLFYLLEVEQEKMADSFVEKFWKRERPIKAETPTYKLCALRSRPFAS
jgi:hypothetical protein